MTPETNTNRQNLALASLSLCTLLSSLGTTSANVALPDLGRAFNAPFQNVQWIVLAYLLGVTSLIVSAGKLGDLIGRKRLLLAGLAIFSVASAVCAAATSLFVLIAARAVQGIGASVLMALTMAFVAGTAAKERTGVAMGLLGTMSAIGTALGPSLGGLLLAQFGWPAVFLINAPLGVIALILAWAYLPADRREKVSAKFDCLGTMLLALTLAAYALAMTVGHGRFGALNITLIVASVAGLSLFVSVQNKAASPLIRLTLLKQPVLSAGLGLSALVSTVLMATLIVGPFYLSGALGLNAAQTGGVMSAGPLVAAFAGVPSGRLVDRFGAQAMTIAGLTGIAFGCALLAIIPVQLGIAGYVIPIIAITASYALFQTANNTGVMSVVGDERGAMSGLLNLARNLGLITGAAAMGALFAFVSANAPAQAEAASFGMRITFAVAAMLVVGGLVIALGVRTGSVRHAQ